MKDYYEIPTETVLQKRESALKATNIEKVNPEQVATFQNAATHLVQHIQSVMLRITKDHSEPLPTALSRKLDQSDIHHYFTQLYGALFAIYQEKVAFVMTKKHMQVESGGPSSLLRAWKYIDSDLSPVEYLAKSDYVFGELYKVIDYFLLVLAELDLFCIHKLSFIEVDGTIRLPEKSSYQKLRSEGLHDADVRMLKKFLVSEVQMQPMSDLLTSLSTISFARHALLATPEEKEQALANIRKVMPETTSSRWNSSLGSAVRYVHVVSKNTKNIPETSKEFLKFATDEQAKDLHDQLTSMKQCINKMSYLSDEEMANLKQQVPHVDVGMFHIEVQSFCEGSSQLAKVSLETNGGPVLDILSSVPDFTLAELPHLALGALLEEYGVIPEVVVLKCMIFSYLIALVQQYKKNVVAAHKQDTSTRNTEADLLTQHLSGIHTSYHERLLSAMRRIENGNFTGLDVKKLEVKKSYYRARIGRIRIVFRKVEDRYVIENVGERGHVYDGL